MLSEFSLHLWLMCQRSTKLEIPFRPAVIRHIVMGPKDWIGSGSEAPERSTDRRVATVVGRTFDLLAERKEVRVAENGVQDRRRK